MIDESYSKEKLALIEELKGLINRIENTTIISFVLSRENILSDPIWREGRNSPSVQETVGFTVKLSVMGRKKKGEK